MQRLEKRFIYLLVPGLVQMAAPFAVLPLATRVLTAEHYGIFALASVIALFGRSISALGVGQVFYHFHDEKDPERNSEMISSLLFVSLLSGGSFALAVMFGWPQVTAIWPEVRVLSWFATGVAVFDGMFGGVIALAQIHSIIARSPAGFAYVQIGQSLVSMVVVLGLIYGLGMDDETVLLIGLLCASVIGLAGCLLIIRRHLRLAVIGEVMRECVQVGLSIGLANCTHGLRQLTERSLLASAAGFSTLGAMAHAQQYPHMFMHGVRAISNATTPALREDVRDQRNYERVIMVQDLSILILTGAGAVLLFLAEPFIDWLSNGQFTDLAWVTPILVAAAMIERHSIPQMILLIVCGKGRELGVIDAAAAACAMGTALLVIPVWGVIGVVAAAGVFGVCRLVLLNYFASKVGAAPKALGLLVFSATLLTAGAILAEALSSPIIHRAWWALGVLLAVFWGARRSIQAAIAELMTRLRDFHPAKNEKIAGQSS